MKVLGSIIFIQIISIAIAGILIPTAKIIEGPSSKTTLVGPDGSVITSVAQGAKIVADDNTAVVAGPDTAALLKSADNVAELHPIVAAPSSIIESHVLTPNVATKTILTEHKQIVPDGTISFASGHLHPVYSEPLVKSHVIPAIAEKYLTTHHVGTKTSISEQSQTVVHPHSIEKTYLEAAPLEHADAVVVQNEPLVAARVVPAIASKAVVTHVEPAISTIETKVVPGFETKLAAVPVVSEKITHEVIGSKTTVSEHGTSIHHPSTLIESHQAVVAHPVPVIAKAAHTIAGHSQAILHPGTVLQSQPIATINTVPLEVEHHIPVAAVHSVPVIGTKHIISENSQTLLSHSW